MAHGNKLFSQFLLEAKGKREEASMLHHVKTRLEKSGFVHANHKDPNKLKVGEFYVKSGAGAFDGHVRVKGNEEGESHLVPLNIKHRSSPAKKPHINVALEIPQESEIGKKVSTVAHRRASRAAPRTYERSVQRYGKTPEALFDTRKESKRAKVKLSRLIGQKGEHKTHPAAIQRRRKLATAIAKQVDSLSKAVHIVGDGNHISVITSDSVPGHSEFISQSKFERTGNLDHHLENSANVVRTERGIQQGKLPTVTHSVSFTVPKDEHRSEGSKRNAEGYKLID